MKLTQLEKLIVSTSLLALILVLTRVYVTKTTDYVFMVWNLFLAYLPLLFARLAVQTYKSFLRYSYALAWLLFYPNALYIITDFIHVGHAHSFGYVLYDFFLVTVFVLIALVLGFLSLYHMVKLCKSRLRFIASRKNRGLFVVVLVSILTGFGIYLGRFLRLNSWDLLVNPLNMQAVFTQIFSDLEHFGLALGSVLLFGGLNMLLFFVFQHFFNESE